MTEGGAASGQRAGGFSAPARRLHRYGPQPSAARSASAKAASTGNNIMKCARIRFTSFQASESGSSEPQAPAERGRGPSLVRLGR
jgi:hypothetical protein